MQGKAFTKVRGLGVLAVALVAGSAAASDTVAPAPVPSPDPLPAYLINVPPEAQAIAPALRRVLQVAQSSAGLEQSIRQLRADLDAVKTKLASANGEAELLNQQHQQLVQELSVLERATRDRVEALRKDLEAKLEAELAQARQSIAQEQQDDFARQLQAFEGRQSEAITRALTKDMELRERELEQMAQELAIQTEGLVNQFSRLDLDAQMAQSIQRSAQEALARKKAELELQRSRIDGERDARLAAARQDFTAKLQRRYAAEADRRLTMKEASLRSVMAELLHKTSQEENNKAERARQQLADVQRRLDAIAQQQAQLGAQVERYAGELNSKLDQAAALEGQRTASLVKLEQAFQNPHPEQHEQALAWFTQALPSFPPEVAADLEALQQRMSALIQQERELAEQRRVLRERQLALQLSRELELQYQRNQLKQQQEDAARAQKADAFIERANELAAREQYDDAIRVLAQAQAMNPPQLERITALRDEVASAKTAAEHKRESAKIEQLFNQAMAVFQQGRYEDAMVMFEQVIGEEAKVRQKTGGAD